MGEHVGDTGVQPADSAPALAVDGSVWRCDDTGANGSTVSTTDTSERADSFPNSCADSITDPSERVDCFPNILAVECALDCANSSTLSVAVCCDGCSDCRPNSSADPGGDVVGLPDRRRHARFQCGLQ